MSIITTLINYVAVQMFALSSYMNTNEI